MKNMMYDPCHCGKPAEHIHNKGWHWIVCEDGHITRAFSSKELVMHYWKTRDEKDAAKGVEMETDDD